MLSAGRKRRIMGLAVAAVAAVLMASGAPSLVRGDEEADDQVWKVPLTLQLKDSFACDIATYVYVRKLPSEDGMLIEGRARCHDGREFTFTRPKPHMPFFIESCEPTVC